MARPTAVVIRNETTSSTELPRSVATLCAVTVPTIAAWPRPAETATFLGVARPAEAKTPVPELIASLRARVELNSPTALDPLVVRNG